MENNHKLGLYVSYYLSRFDKEAYKNLGYGKQRATHQKIGELLDINSYTIHNWRDQFDPLHGHRVGWYQREITQSRINVARALEDLNEPQVRSIVNDILSGKIIEEPQEEAQLLSIDTDDSKDKQPKKFILRTPTGKAAENYFIQYFKETSLPKNGVLNDCRDLGCGYDFLIKSPAIDFCLNLPNSNFYNYLLFIFILESTSYFVCKKLFINKEWSIANAYGENYYLCIVKNILDNPQIIFIQNPASKLKPKKNIFTTIQINWSVTEKEINNLDYGLL